MKIMLIVGFFVTSASAQSFTNLDFEAASLASVPAGQFGGPVPISQALPGWTGSDGVDTLTQVFQNSFSLGQVSIDILGPNWDSSQTGFFSVIQGHYSVALQAGDATQGHVSAILEQNGFVPLATKALLFYAAGDVSSGFLTVGFNGQNLPIFTLAPGPNDSEEYGVDISAFAGHSGLLTFSENPVGQSFFGAVALDNISFSPNVIPEPSTYALMLCGAGLFGLRQWKRMKHSSCNLK